MEKLNKSDQEIASEEIEDEAIKKVGRKKKARLRTRGPYRKASTKNCRIRVRHLTGQQELKGSYRGK